MKVYLILLLIAAFVFVAESSPGHKSKSTAVHSKQKHQGQLEIVPETFETKSKPTEFLPIVKKYGGQDNIAPTRRTKRQNISQKVRPVATHGAQPSRPVSGVQPSRRDGNRRPGPTQHRPVVHQHRPAVRPVNHQVRKAVHRPVHHAVHRPSVHPGNQAKPVHSQQRPVVQKNNGPSVVQHNKNQQASATRPSTGTSNQDRFAGGRGF